MDNQCAARGVWSVRVVHGQYHQVHRPWAVGRRHPFDRHLRLGAYLRGREAFRDALDPTAMKTYLTLLPLTPGLLLLWLGDLLAARRRS